MVAGDVESSGFLSLVPRRERGTTRVAKHGVQVAGGAVVHHDVLEQAERGTLRGQREQTVAEYLGRSRVGMMTDRTLMR